MRTWLAMKRLPLLLASLLLMTVPAGAETLRPVLVIAHRGASALRPEHSLAAYRLAIEAGADYIEPDLVMTRDGILVARHENEISETTDVAAHPEFSDRRTNREIDGQSVTGWFTEDFTLAELRTLRARERLPDLRPASRGFDGLYPIATLAEILELVRTERARGRAIGVYPELKHPSHFRALGLPMEQALLDGLAAAGLDSGIFIQCFEPAALQRLRGMTHLPLVQLIDDDPAGDAITTPAGLREVATYADAIGPSKGRIYPRTADDDIDAPTHLVAEAHAAGLVVHVYTFRPENQFLPRQLRIGTDPAARGHIADEYRIFIAQGIDGLFADDPATALQTLGKLPR